MGTRVVRDVLPMVINQFCERIFDRLDADLTRGQADRTAVIQALDGIVGTAERAEQLVIERLIAQAEAKRFPADVGELQYVSADIAHWLRSEMPQQTREGARLEVDPHHVDPENDTTPYPPMQPADLEKENDDGNE